MTVRPDLETRLSQFLVSEAPARAPERLVEVTRRGLAGTPQRRRIRLLPVRMWSALLTPAGLAVSVAVIALVATTFVISTRSVPSVGIAPSPSPSPSPTPPPSPAPSACPPGQGTCLGPLVPGTYRSTSFLPAFSYAVTTGWAKTGDNRGELDLQYAAGGQYTYPDGLTFHDGISVFRRPVAESAAIREPLAGIGTTAIALARWLAGHPDLVASARTPVTIGGASGYRLTLSLPTGTRTAPDHCTTDHGEPRCASLFLSSDPNATYGFGLVGPERAVVFLLDLPSRDTVMVVIDDVDGVRQPELEAAAMPIVNSLSFSP
jgi:hypothetical protein